MEVDYSQGGGKALSKTSVKPREVTEKGFRWELSAPIFLAVGELVRHPEGEIWAGSPTPKKRLDLIFPYNS